MKINQELLNKWLIIIKNNWKLFSIGGVIFLFLVITLLIPGKDKGDSANPARENTVNGPTGSAGKSSAKKPFNLFGIFPQTDKNKKNDQVSDSSIFPTPPLGLQSTKDKFTISSLSASGNQTGKTIIGSTTVRTTQGTISTQANIQSDVAGNDQQDLIRIVFQNPDGSTTTYIPPGTPPDEVRWGRYTNEKSKYAINFPSNWQFFYSIDADGHEGIALYPPNTNPNDQSSPFIGFGITEKFVLPTVGDATDAYVTPLVVDGVLGSLYTNGPLGNSYVASVLQYSSKHFGLGASKSDTTFAYVYYYMLNSLTFNTQ